MMPQDRQTPETKPVPNGIIPIGTISPMPWRQLVLSISTLQNGLSVCY